MSAAGGAPGAVEPMASTSCCRPAEGHGEIRRPGFSGTTTCFKGMRLQNRCSGIGLHPVVEGEHLEVHHAEKSIIQFDDMLSVSAGDAERSGWKEGYDLHGLVVCGRCSGKLAGDANCYFFEEEEVKDDSPRGLQRDGVLHSETQGRDRGNKEDTLQLEHCTSMSSVSGGEVSDLSAEEFDNHDVASGV